MKTIRARLPAILFLWGFLLGMPFYHIPTFTKGPLICALIGQEKSVYEIFTQPHLWTYRPLLVLMFSTLYKLFGFHYEPYRIFASIFSGFFAVFVYLFLLELHPSRKIAFFATLIFTLTTPFLDGLWDLSEGGFYSTCLFYGGFLFFVKLSKCDGNHKLENRYTFLFLLFSLLSLLIKETTRAMAPPILFLYCYFLKANPKQWRLFWIFCGLSVLTLLPMLSAPPEPGSRAAVTTPFWEVAKIAFQINVTQLMSVFHYIFIVLLFLYALHLVRANIWKKALSIFPWGSGHLCVTIFFLFFLSFDSYITYFSAKYFPDGDFFAFNMLFGVLSFSFVLIYFRGDTFKKFLCASIAAIFFSYFAGMTLIPTLRLEPSSRHYMIIIPLLILLITDATKTLASRISLLSEKDFDENIESSILIAVFVLIFSWHLAASALNLGAEFMAIGKAEFPAWNFVRQNGLKDTAVFSPADGYALPPEYLRVAGTDAPYAFYQLPRWFPSQAEFESHFRHTIDKNHLQKARKIFYYSKYGRTFSKWLIRDRRNDCPPRLMFHQDEFSNYMKIGYWNHVLAIHDIVRSPLELYLSEIPPKHRLQLIYERKYTFNEVPESLGIFLKNILFPKFRCRFVAYRKQYLVQIFIEEPQK